ncbi:phosphonoacetaldehyde hydrolase [Murimonas intestini]|uniref:Phosphonoacetaldehyde hydrolase n=1 Tax=Murimonas intestini TaxID=1337051 RepID=A0AB73T7T0_9FIRM|nr:phosphonoacetaldehyde hydrolase [Murimonas intestini]MCR1841247.1 phosphonoacetaldehyde hydrolase [Murimonas intestini]MCR1866165.1 phosphonoacetaldehyde hydrolase [Murimonas intestini]MCR1882718.1 phosphonoacetaldehyde hydrolase [Murimonas intestini]
MKTKLIILDWAGTTVDYGCFAPVNAFALAFKTCGIDASVDEIRAPMGMLKRDHIRTMLEMKRIHDLWAGLYGTEPDEDDVDRIYGVFEESLMESLANYAAPKSGTVETAARLRKMGLAIGSTTGYTDKMMKVVAQKAAEQGYAPDACFTPDSVGGLGRPYPYMIYANMQKMRIDSVYSVVKVGDTLADIKEGKNAGVKTLGVIEGSSALGLCQAEFEALPAEEKSTLTDKVRKMYLAAGADGVLYNLAELPGWLEAADE